MISSANSSHSRRFESRIFSGAEIKPLGQVASPILAVPKSTPRGDLSADDFSAKMLLQYQV